MREGQRPREGQEPAPSPPSHGSDALPASGQRSTISLTASCPLRPRHGAWSAQGYTSANHGAWVCPAAPRPQEAPKGILPTVSSVIPAGQQGGRGWQVSIPGKLARAGASSLPSLPGQWPPHSAPLAHLLSPKGRCSPLSRPHHPIRLPSTVRHQGAFAYAAGAADPTPRRLAGRLSSARAGEAAKAENKRASPAPGC